MSNVIEELKAEYISYFKKATMKKIDDNLYNALDKFAALQSGTENFEDMIDIEDEILKRPLANTYITWLPIYNYIEIDGKKKIAYVINTDNIYNDELRNKADKEGCLHNYKDDLFGLGYLKRVANVEIQIYVYYKDEHGIDIPSRNLSWINNICDYIGVEPNNIFYFSNRYIEYFINKLATNKDINSLPFKDIVAIGKNVNVFCRLFDNVMVLKDLMPYLKEGIEKRTLKKLIDEYVNYKINIFKLRSDNTENVKEEMYKYLLYTSRLTHILDHYYAVCYYIDNEQKIKTTSTLFCDIDVVKIDYNNLTTSQNEYYKADKHLEIFKGYNDKDEFQLYVLKDSFNASGIEIIY